MDVSNIRLGKIFNNVKIKASAFFNHIKGEKRYFFLAAIFAIVVAGSILPAGNVLAASVGESVGGFVLDLIAPLLYLIFYVFLYIAYIVAWIGADVINITLDPSIMNSVLNISAGSSLYQGWSIFRDIANLLFILILLLIAFGTIFQSNTYNAKKSLPMLILVAFLINFSAMITGVVIDFTNILMFGIIKMMCAGSATSCSQDFFSALMKVADDLFNKYSITGALSFDFKDAAAIAISAIYVFIYGIILMALGVFLLIRIAFFALLVVVSPLAFFGLVAPGLKSLYSKWWDNLLQYAFFGPIAALMLYVSGLMAQNTIAIPAGIFELNPEMSWIQQDISLMITNIIPLIFLFMIIPITKSMGIMGASAVYAGAAAATFSGMAVAGKAWGQGKLFPGQQHVTNAGKSLGGLALKSGYINRKWTGAGYKGQPRDTTGGLKGKLGRLKKDAASRARGVGVRGYTAGGAYDSAAQAKKKIDMKLFGESKTLGGYANMAMRGMNPVLLEAKYKDWLKKSHEDNYKIPLGASPDERRKIELMEANKKISELKGTGILDNPDAVADRAAEEFKKGNHLEFEILTKMLASQDKQYRVLATISRETGANYSENGEGWAQFLNDYKGKVGENQASTFGQIVGNSAKKEGNYTASEIAYYKGGKNYIRDFTDTTEHKEPGADGKDVPIMNPVTGKNFTVGDYNKKMYIDKNAESMGRAPSRTRMNNASADNFVTNGKFSAMGVKFFKDSLTNQEMDNKFENMSTDNLHKLAGAFKATTSDTAAWDAIFKELGVADDAAKKGLRDRAEEVSKKAEDIVTANPNVKKKKKGNRAEEEYDDSQTT